VIQNITAQTGSCFPAIQTPISVNVYVDPDLESPREREAGFTINDPESDILNAITKGRMNAASHKEAIIVINLMRGTHYVLRNRGSVDFANQMDQVNPTQTEWIRI